MHCERIESLFLVRAYRECRVDEYPFRDDFGVELDVMSILAR